MKKYMLIGTVSSVWTASWKWESTSLITHAIILEGGFNDEDKFISIPFAGLQKNDVQFFRGKIARQFGLQPNCTNIFRRKVIWLFVEKELINEEFARNLLSWKHSGFSIDAVKWYRT